MKAMICTRFGGPEVLELHEVAAPEPGPRQLLVRVHATSVGYGDLLARDFGAVGPREFTMPLLFWLLTKLFLGARRPKVTILGAEFAGVVERVGRDVTAFRVGDEVFGYLGQSMGADAELLCVAEGACVAHKPSAISFEEAAVIPYGATLALDLLKKAKIRPGERVLVIGASGGLGSAAVQLLARHFGAEVTGVCGPASLEYVRSLGASAVLDHARDDLAQRGTTYDVIFDVLGKSSWARCEPLLNEGGRYLRASFKGRELLQMLWTSLSRRKRRVICALAPGDRAALLAVKELVEAGTLRAGIDRTFPLERLADAHRYAESGAKHGHVVVRVR